jgi:hypothetical protein
VPTLKKEQNSRDFSNKQLMIHLNLLEKQEQTKTQTHRQRKIIKIRAGINDNKNKKLYKESKKQKGGL